MKELFFFSVYLDCKNITATKVYIFNVTPKPDNPKTHAKKRKPTLKCCPNFSTKVAQDLSKMSDGDLSKMSDGESKFQRVNPYNRFLPYADSVDLDASNYLDEIKANLKECLTQKPFDRNR